MSKTPVSEILALREESSAARRSLEEAWHAAKGERTVALKFNCNMGVEDLIDVLRTAPSETVITGAQMSDFGRYISIALTSPTFPPVGENHPLPVIDIDPKAEHKWLPYWPRFTMG